jgi:VanZ family protein
MEKASKKTIFFSYFIPILAWMGVVYYFSSVPDLRYTQEVKPEIILRKGAHLLEYIFLVFLLWRMFLRIFYPNLKKAYYLSFLAASLYAVTDEFHQTFVPGRSGRVEDVVYDIVSIFIGLQFLFLFKKKNNKNKKKFLFSILIAVFVLLGMEYRMIKKGEAIQNQKKTEQTKAETDKGKEQKSSNESKEIPVENSVKAAPDVQEKSEDIPDKIKIQVPFTSQAPFSKWDAYHEEACEEASLIMIKYYIDGKALNKDIAEKEIQDMIKFEIKKYGDYKDTNASETVKLAEDFYGIENFKVVYDFKPEDIKKYLAKGKPVIVPAAGRKLGNPNFTPPGPLYHNLVLTGYNGDIVTTNDPGTRKGENYTYSLSVLYGAIHDFPGQPEDIEKGRKAMIVME